MQYYAAGTIHADSRSKMAYEIAVGVISGPNCKCGFFCTNTLKYKALFNYFI